MDVLQWCRIWFIHTLGRRRAQRLMPMFTSTWSENLETWATDIWCDQTTVSSSRKDRFYWLCFTVAPHAFRKSQYFIGSRSSALVSVDIICIAIQRTIWQGLVSVKVYTAAPHLCLSWSEAQRRRQGHRSVATKTDGVRSRQGQHFGQKRCFFAEF